MKKPAQYQAFTPSQRTAAEHLLYQIHTSQAYLPVIGFCYYADLHVGKVKGMKILSLRNKDITLQMTEKGKGRGAACITLVRDKVSGINTSTESLGDDWRDIQILKSPINTSLQGVGFFPSHCIL